ncbi:phage tail sheath protein [Alteromonadaceae bacterium M269]|nr:phage tail sheath protein [Alteromonadaceae bacterium M269]
MPEYLAPGVYVEEVSSGNKPIEGVSTSTAGMVGVTARGPVNVPTLVTSLGGFNRVFGGKLDYNLYTNNLDALPYAAEGFFNNGGSRVYVTRIVGDNAARSEAALYSESLAGSAAFELSAGIAVNGTSLRLGSGPFAQLAADVKLLFSEPGKSDVVEIQSVDSRTISINRGLGAEIADAAAFDVCSAVLDEDVSVNITQDMSAAGTLQIDATLTATLSNLDTLFIEDTIDPNKSEYITINADAVSTFAENGGALLFDHPVSRTRLHKVTITVDKSFTANGAAAAAATNIAINESLTGQEALIRTAGEYYLINGGEVVLTLKAGITQGYLAGANARFLDDVFCHVHGIYPGAWGNNLRAMALPKSLLQTQMSFEAADTDTEILLKSVFAIQKGTYLRFSVAPDNIVVRKVTGVDRSGLKVTIESPLGVIITADRPVESIEFDLVVERLEADKIVESERIDDLAIDAEHPRYAPRIVGSYDSGSQTISKSGASELVRLGGFNDGNAPLTSVFFDLASGDDDLASIDDQSFVGTASDDPDQRTGIQAMINENDISIVAVPGQTSVDVQKALIVHCERMRYRFAVLDSEKSAKLAGVQTHRKNYDTTYAAYYYPWLTIADPFGERGDELNVAPSGHVLGIYARTDVQRGVHKAPANEVVKAIRSFETRLTKGEQDILNPGHINCFRDFRDANRGLRLYGARTLSSDPEWKYVNVRRLFLFIEKSIDDGMQWAVFEPNAEPLWATVHRSLTNFLLTVWRSGALEGVTQDEAFFVNVGLDTMSQADIDNGRLIVEIGVAPVKPAEFVIFRISQKARGAQ